MKLTAFTCERFNGVQALPTAVFALVFQLYDDKWNIVKLHEFEREPRQGEQEIYDKVQTLDLRKVDPIASNCLINGLTQWQLDANEQAMEIDRIGFEYALRRSARIHGKLPSAASSILGKLANK